jgi:ankyrin repeat protein
MMLHSEFNYFNKSEELKKINKSLSYEIKRLHSYLHEEACHGDRYYKDERAKKAKEDFERQYNVKVDGGTFSVSEIREINVREKEQEMKEREEIFKTGDYQKFIKLRFYIDNDWYDCVKYKMMQFALWLNSNVEKFPKHIVDYALNKENYEVVEYIVRNRKELFVSEHIDDLVKKGDRTSFILLGMFKKIDDSRDTTSKQFKRKAGKFVKTLGISENLLDWMSNNEEKVMKQNAMDYAAEQGDIEAVRGLHALGRTCTTNAMDQAAKKGHFEVVELLHQLGKDCTTNAIDQAAEKGHYKIVKFLIEIGKKCSHYAMNAAAREGHLDIIKFLDEQGNDCTTEAIDFAAESNKLEVVKYLFRKGKECNRATQLAASKGHLSMLQWFYINKRGECEKEMEIYWAKQNGHMEIVEWLNENVEDDEEE